MLKMWEFIAHGCWHDWQEKGRGDIVDSRDRQTGYYFMMKCKKCSRYKKVDV